MRDKPIDVGFFVTGSSLMSADALRQSLSETSKLSEELSRSYKSLVTKVMSQSFLLERAHVLPSVDIVKEYGKSLTKLTWPNLDAMVLEGISNHVLIMSEKLTAGAGFESAGMIIGSYSEDVDEIINSINAHKLGELRGGDLGYVQFQAIESERIDEIMSSIKETELSTRKAATRMHSEMQGILDEPRRVLAETTAWLGDAVSAIAKERVLEKESIQLALSEFERQFNSLKDEGADRGVRS